MDPEAGCGVGPGSLEVGAVRVGRLETLPPEGGDLPIIRGPQGGIHVLVGCWVDEADLDLTLEYRLRDEATEAEVGLPTRLSLRPSSFDRTGRRPERSPDLLILDDAADPVGDYAGRRVWLEAEVWTGGGSHLCDRRTATLTAD